VSPAEAWIRERLGDAPPALLDAMVKALPADADRSIPDVLAEAALSLLGTLAAGNGGREDALPLLAADALLTHAFEAQAEFDPDGLAALADRFGAAGALGRFARVS
jgi:hypothetical protein